MKKGFTIIELLVVVAIIGVLAAFIMVSISGAQARARDTQRKNDIATIVKSLESYFSDYEKYPYYCDYGVGACSTAGRIMDSSIQNTAGNDWTSNGDANAGYTPGGLLRNTLVTNGYIKDLPNDPINSRQGSISYTYVYMGTNGNALPAHKGGDKYAIFTNRLENTNDANICAGTNRPYFILNPNGSIGTTCASNSYGRNNASDQP